MDGRHRPLHGIRVLDLSRVLSGPSAGRALADLGADVIKLEPPDGDVTRTAQPRIAGLSPYFTQQNVGKRNVSIDLQHPKGSALGLALAAKCDVVLENFRPGVMDRLGIGYDAVAAQNPRVVYCSITGYGTDNPQQNRRAYAPVIQAEVGYMELAARKRGGPPAAETLSHADLYSGMQAVVGILAALNQRHATGRGQRVEVSMAETLLFANEWTATELVTGGQEQMHIFGGYNAPVLQLGDGTWVCVPGDPLGSFPNWTRAMQRPDLMEDTRFATPQARAAHRQDMHEVLQAWVKTFDDFDALEAALGTVRIAVGRVRSSSDAARDEWSSARGALAEIDDRDGGTMQIPRSPLRFSGADVGARGVAAWRGEHNEEILSGMLGLSSRQIADLVSEGVLSSRLPDEAT